MSEDSTNGVSWSVVASRSTKSNSQKKKSFAGPLQSELVQSSVLGADQKENLILVLDTGAIIKGRTNSRFFSILSALCAISATFPPHLATHCIASHGPLGTNVAKSL